MVCTAVFTTVAMELGVHGVVELAHADTADAVGWDRVETWPFAL